MSDMIDRPRARHDDPSTSHAGAVDVEKRLNAYQSRCLVAYFVHGYLRAELVERITGIVGAWKRVSELLAAGLIEQVGTEIASTGSRQRVFRLSAEGHRRAFELVRNGWTPGGIA